MNYDSSSYGMQGENRGSSPKRPFEGDYKVRFLKPNLYKMNT